MGAVLTDAGFAERHGARMQQLGARHGRELVPMLLPEDPEAWLSEEDLGRIELACFTGTWDSDPVFARRFFGSTLRAPGLAWMHLPNAGTDHPVFGMLLDRGVRLTTSSSATAEPIAQAAIAGVLWLARGFPAWAEAARRRAWQPHRELPTDLRGRTMVVVGLGAIGNEVARLARALGLRVVGVRRSPRLDGDHADEVVPPSRLDETLPRADWLVLACPLTDETRGLVDARRLALLPPGARFVNVARGGLVDEPELIRALADGRVGGAYLDVFAEEPLPASSPLWEMPNVLVTPHDAGASAGNADRVAGIFLDNLGRWLRGEPLPGEVVRAG
ncbi:MAG: D-2-hydroxyacid dehydrogenase [Alphaproteobacteria bacterium]